MRCPKCEAPLPNVASVGVLEWDCQPCGIRFESNLAMSVAQVVVEAGFRIVLTGDRHFFVYFDDFRIADVEVWLYEIHTVIVVEQFVFGDLRPKIDELVHSFECLPVVNLHTVIVRS